MIKLAPLLREIEVIRPFNGRITNRKELETYLNIMTNLDENIINAFGALYDIRKEVYIPIGLSNLKNLRYVDGDLKLAKSDILKLPDGLSVNGDLDIRYLENISEIPNKLKIKNSLYCFGTPLSKQYSSEEIEQLIVNKGGNVQQVYS